MILTTPVQLLMAHSVSIDVEASTRAVNYSLPTYQPNLLVASQRDSVHSKKVIDSPVNSSFGTRCLSWELLVMTVNSS